MFNSTKIHSTSSIKSIILIASVIIFLVSQFTAMYGNDASAESYTAANLNVNDLYNMALNGNGQNAVNQVADVAYNLGQWQPAPGDTIAYDGLMSVHIRGAMVDYDEVPAICRDKNQVPDPVACVETFRAQEKQVRFGRSFFSTPQADGTVSLRTADDIVGTYIEEVGHSWQEYAFETDGQMNGERIHTTSLEDAHYWSSGREYQIKMYILGLDGILLELSDAERTSLVESVCMSNLDYAYPIGHEVPSYGPPSNWPHPEFWPTTAPTLHEHMDFCAAELQ